MDPPNVRQTTHRAGGTPAAASAYSTGSRQRRFAGASPMIALGAAASVVAAGLVIALVAVVGASSGPAATTNGEATHQSLRIAAQSPDATGTLQLGDVTAGLSHSSLRADLTAPGGPTVTPDIALGVEPGAAVDGLVSGQVAVHTPTIASVRSIGVNLGAEGKITTTVHQWAGILSTHP